jgi:hypothetical protein
MAHPNACGTIEPMSRPATWVHHRVEDPDQRHAYTAVEELADWSPWLPFNTAVTHAPRQPGVYLVRQPGFGNIVYVGHAGPRASSGRTQGIYGRLSVYRSGKGAVSGFGEAALDRALADPNFLQSQWSRVQHDKQPQRARAWAAEAVRRLVAEVSWAVTPDKVSAAQLEKRVEAVLRPHGIWNR